MDKGQQFNEPKKEDVSVWDAVQNLGGEILQPFVRPALSGATSPIRKVLGNKSISLGESKLYDPNYGKKGLDADVAKDITGVAATLALGRVAGAAGGGAGKAGAPKLPKVETPVKPPVKTDIPPSKAPKFFDDAITPKSGGSTTSGYPRTGGTSSGPARGGSKGTSTTPSGGYTTGGGAATKTKPKTQTPWAPEYSPSKAEPLPPLLPKTKPAVKPSAKPTLKPAEKPKVKAEVKTEPKVSTKEETKTSPKEETKGKSKSTNRTKNFVRAAAAASLLGGKDDSKNDPSKWTASGVV